jgi:hypothetical protein
MQYETDILPRQVPSALIMHDRASLNQVNNYLPSVSQEQLCPVECAT